MLYKLIDNTRYLQGLSMMPELDDITLSEDQKPLLEQAVEIGIYVPANAPAPFLNKAKKVVTNDLPDEKSSAQ